MSERERLFGRMEHIAWFLDEGIRIPGTKLRVGADAVIGLIPGAGDAVTAGLSLYLVWGAWRLGLPARALAEMLVNVFVDLTVGSVPVVGDLFDWYWRASRWNMEIVRRYAPVTA